MYISLCKLPTLNTSISHRQYCFIQSFTFYLPLPVGSDGCLYKTEVPLGDGLELDENKMTDLGCELVSRLSDVSLSISKVRKIWLEIDYFSHLFWLHNARKHLTVLF